MTALGCKPSCFASAIPCFSETGSILNVSSLTSTKIGVAPTSTTTSAVAQKVNEGQITASPGPTSFARSTMSNASVPLAQLTTCLLSEKEPSSTSRCATSGPLMN